VSDENDDKPVNVSPDAENPQGGKPSSAEPPRFWGSPSPQSPVDPTEFGVSSNADEPEADTTPSWIQPHASPSPSPSEDVNEPSPSGSVTPPPGGPASVPPPMAAQQDPGQGTSMRDVPVFQPPSASGAKRKFELRPFTVADILDATFQLMKSNWKSLSLLSLLYAVPAGIITAVTNSVGATNDEDNVLGQAVPFLSGIGSSVSGLDLVIVIIASGLSLVLTLLLQPLIQGAITRLVAANFVGREMGPREAFNGVKNLWLVFAGASFLTILAMIGGLIVFLVGFVIAAVLFAVVIPIIAIEEEGAFNAMGRSWALMKRGFWRYLGVLAVMLILSTLIAFAIVLIPGIIASVLRDAHLDAIAFVFDAFGSAISELVVFPISAIAATLVYFDARVRFEGFDVQLMAARLPQPPTAPNNGPGNL
jgi:hypothetical protein